VSIVERQFSSSELTFNDFRSAILADHVRRCLKPNRARRPLLAADLRQIVDRQFPVRGPQEARKMEAAL
jgi:hypothetical protein